MRDAVAPVHAPDSPRLADLAIFGGAPTYPAAQTLHVGRPNVGDRARIRELIDGVLDRRWFTNAGPCVGELEERLCAFLGVRHCIPMCNATVALEIAIRALGMTGEVIVPSFTFVATAHALQWQEVTPVFADVDPATHCLDVAAVERMITPRTTGIIGVHLWGRACDVEGLTALARGRGLRLLFDAAHAFACSHRGTMIGSFGQAEVFSFHATKFFNTFEGGAVATNDDELAARIRLMKNFGFAGYDKVVYVGTNGKMNEVSAAMGLASLESLDDFVAANRRNHELYRAALADLPGIRVLGYDPAERNNYQYVVLEVDPARSGIARDDLYQMLWTQNVRARRYFYPGCHGMEPYRSHFPHAGLVLPVTRGLCERVLLLPTGTAVSPDDVARVCGLVRLGHANGPTIRARLAELGGGKEGSVCLPQH